MKHPNIIQLSKKESKSIKKTTESVQPDNVRAKDLEGCSEKDCKVYDFMNENIYKKMCGEDLSFHVAWVSPDSRKTFTFYRLYHLDNNEQHRAKYYDSLLRLGKACLNFVAFTNFSGLIECFNYRNPNEISDKETNI